MTIQVFLGTVAYTDYLHVRVEKVGSPGVTIWETWIDVPVTNYTFVIPDLDADNYYIKFYDALTNVALGTLASECFVSALSSEFQYEIRFYEGGNLPVTASLSVDGTVLTDTYLIGKIVQSVEKEGFRTIDPANEYSYVPASGQITLNFTTLATGEKLVVCIKNRVGTSSSASGGIYNGTMTITAATQTLLPTDKNKRVRLYGNQPTQVITLPLLASISVDDGFYFDNSVGNDTIQPKIIIQGLDRIHFCGFTFTNTEYQEFWASQGEHLLLRKFNDNYWEVISDYKGTNVGERLAAGYLSHPNTLPEDGRLVDGDEYPRLYYWIKNILQANHYLIDDAVINLNYVQPLSRIGQFAIHSTLKKIRMPKTSSFSERGLSSFTSYGLDGQRSYDYPGGFQIEMVGPHNHNFNTDDQVFESDNANDRSVMVPGSSIKTTQNNTGIENRVNNIGVVFLRRI